MNGDLGLVILWLGTIGLAGLAWRRWRAGAWGIKGINDEVVTPAWAKVGAVAALMAVLAGLALMIIGRV